VTIRAIIHEVAHYYCVPVTALTGPSKAAEYMIPRRLAMYLARELTDSSFATIGKAFGGRHHTTVMEGCRWTEYFLKRGGDPQLGADIAVLREKLAAADVSAEQHRKSSCSVTKALRRLHELEDIGEDIAAACRRMVAELEQFKKGDRES